MHQKGLFDVGAGPESAERSVGCDDTMAWYDYRDGISVKGLTDSTSI